MSLNPKMLWYSVCAVDVFVEYELPDDERWMTTAQRAQYAELCQLAEEHDTVVKCYGTKRGLG